MNLDPGPPGERRRTAELLLTLDRRRGDQSLALAVLNVDPALAG